MPKALSKGEFSNSKWIFHILIATTGLISVPLHIFFSPAPLVSITNLTLHYVIPIFVIFNWLTFEEKVIYSYKYVFYILVYPIFYCIVSLIRGTYDGFYPYFFLNPNGPIPVGVGSYTNVSLFIAGFSFVFFILGFLLILVNRIIFNYKNAKLLNHENT